jgi:hypothetical protein
LHVRRKEVGHALASARGDLDSIFRARQVPDNRSGGVHALGQWLGVHESAADECQLDGLGFVVGEVEEGLSGTAVHELDAEDLGFGERDLDGDGEVGRGRRRLQLFFCSGGLPTLYVSYCLGSRRVYARGLMRRGGMELQLSAIGKPLTYVCSGKDTHSSQCEKTEKNELGYHDDDAQGDTMGKVEAETRSWGTSST